MADSNNGESNETSVSDDNGDETIVHGQQDSATQELLEELLKRMSVLEAKYESTTQQLRESEETRKQLEVKLKEKAVVEQTEVIEQTEVVKQTEVVEQSNILTYALPKKVLDLPEFDGKAEGWPMFIAAFKETSKAYSYSKLENIMRLQKSLKGLAREEVEGLLIDPANVDKIIEILEFKFGQPELLIKSQLQRIKEVQVINENQLERLVPFATKINNLTVFLKQIDAAQHICNPMLLEEAVNKMPMSRRIEWAAHAISIRPFATIEHFNEWIKEKSKIITKATINTIPSDPIGSKQSTYKSQVPRVNAKQVLHTHMEKDRKIMCYNCKGNHYMDQCGEYNQMNVENRWEIVKKLGLCYCCLKRGHSANSCLRKRCCNINGCKKSHHQSLHAQERVQHSTEVQNENVNTIKNITTKLLFKVLPVELLSINGSVISTYAFIDEGSSTTLISEDLVNELGVTGNRNELKLHWIGNKATTVMSLKCNLNIRGKGKDRWLNLTANSISNLQLPVQSVDFKELFEEYHQLNKLPIREYGTAEPTLLIGIDNCHLVTTLKSICCKDDFIAAKTRLGWVVYGKYGHCTEMQRTQLGFVWHTRQIQNDDIDSLNNMITQYFATENYGIEDSKMALESKEVARAKEILQGTTKRVNDRYETGLLWAYDSVQFPDSFAMALRRLKTIENKMLKDNGFGEEYKKEMTNLMNKGYAVKLTKEEASFHNERTWYLPHFGVYNVNKKRKMRLVFDAAAAVQNVSLNSMLLKGPDTNPPLLKILFQFRNGIVGVCADIREMFLQVRVRLEDQDSLRFLWRNGDPSKEVEIYRMQVLIFGASCSPSCAQFVKNINAEQLSNDRDVLDAILNKHYVDDFVASFRSEEQALELSKKVRAVQAHAGFDLRNFISNSKLVQRNMNHDGQQINGMVELKDEAVDKILGMYWNSKTDNFEFHLDMNRVGTDIIVGATCPTKRQLLSTVMSIFDPFGVISDFSIYGKILLQEVWRSGIQWNELIPKDTYVRFRQWIGQLENVKRFKLSRCYSPRFYDSNVKIELHVMVDASEQAFAAVAYWRIDTGNEIEVCFVAGKARCAPIKLLSVPRLELQAAVMGYRLRNSVIDCHDVNISRTVFWSDSRTVLCWIKSDTRNFKPFVAHRVGEILEKSTERDWRWVPTKLNSADAATRAIYPFEYTYPRKWLNGPSFLKEREQFWPAQDVLMKTKECIVEQRKFVNKISVEKIIEWERYSNFMRLTRVVAWMFRPLLRIRLKEAQRLNGELNSFEIEYSKKVICKLAQREVYLNEIESLEQYGHVKKSSSIHKLCPVLNEDHLIVLRGRLDYATCLTQSQRQPIILPKNHTLTELIVMWYHNRFYHQNDELVINEIRGEFWIVSLRNIMKRVKSKCQYCKNNRAAPATPIMGQLPIDRVTPYIRPFSYTGLDYFGPFKVAIGRRTEKRWVALFTCLTIRAVHIELAGDLSTDACLLCIRNFVNRRGVPIVIRSDMGTNFVGADGEIRKLKDFFDVEHIKTELAIKRVKWEFNCPGNPSSGGCWERLIQIAKRVLYATLKSHSPQVETLRSLLMEAENIINSRPLTHLPVDPEDHEPLTPNHFLLGSMNSTQTPGEFKENFCLKKQYRISQQLKNNFWKRWMREYLPYLTRRCKWFDEVKPIKTGDVVLICDETLPRGKWSKGVVVKAIAAKDRQVRIAEVKTSSGILKRPVSKLAVLDVLGKPTG